MNRSVLLLVSAISLCTVFPVRFGASQDAATDKRVAVLIERMLKTDTEQKAFSDLEALGCAAVPAIILRMDDRRSLPDPHISLRNKSPYAFEGMRHYGAIQVVDALAVILNQLTGQDFWSHNGAADEERTRMIQGWRKFLQSTPAPDLCDSPQAVEYTLDGGPGQIALYQADSYLSFVPPEFVVQSLEELERRVGKLPPGTRLNWAPYKRDPSGKPILFSDGQFDQFARFCRDHNVELLISSSQGMVQHKSQEPRQPLFVVRERVHPLIGTLDCPQGRVVYGLSYSVITVFTDGKVTHAVWYVPPCSNPAKAREWPAPADVKARDFALSPDALAQLRRFLDRSEVKSLRDFMNAGPGVGDYEIEIRRASGVQRIPVVSLMPEHDELKRDPTLLLLICKAKEIGGDERPNWCPNPPQAEAVGAR